MSLYEPTALCPYVKAVGVYVHTLPGSVEEGTRGSRYGMADVMLSQRKTRDLGEIVMAETLSPHAQTHKTISAFPQKKRMRTWVRGPFSTSMFWRFGCRQRKEEGQA